MKINTLPQNQLQSFLQVVERLKELLSAMMDENNHVELDPIYKDTYKELEAITTESDISESLVITVLQESKTMIENCLTCQRYLKFLTFIDTDRRQKIIDHCNDFILNAMQMQTTINKMLNRKVVHG